MTKQEIRYYAHILYARIMIACKMHDSKWIETIEKEVTESMALFLDFMERHKLISCSDRNIGL